MTQIVLVILLLLSVVSWAFIFFKYRQFSKAQKFSDSFSDDFRKKEELPSLKNSALKFDESPLSAIFLESVRLLQKKGTVSASLEMETIPEEERKTVLENVARVIKRVREAEMNRLENLLSYFAIIGNISPFIGLFGTVLGIIEAFQSISLSGSANIAAVAPGVAEALVATAAGLVTAIPAVIAYNYFLSVLRNLGTRAEGFSEDLLGFFEERLRSSRSAVRSLK